VSASEKAFGAIKALLFHQERMDGVEEKLAALSDRLGRLSDSHVALRERVVAIETFLRTTSGQPFSAPSVPRIEG
jgi:hypothetical protein